MREFKVRLLNSENNKPLKWTEISIFYNVFFLAMKAKQQMMMVEHHFGLKMMKNT